MPDEPMTGAGAPARIGFPSNGQYLGRFMLAPRPGSRPPTQARLAAATVADLTGRALGAATYAPSAR